MVSIVGEFEHLFKHKATKINTIDSGGYFSSTTVEGVLQEVGEDIDNTKTLFDEVKDPTGFIDNQNLVVTGNGDRTITLTNGPHIIYYWHGLRKELGTDGEWTSVAHGTDTSKVYFLYSTDGTNFAWSETSRGFDYIQVAIAFYINGAWRYLRETHGVQNYQDHLIAHQNIGTFRQSGGGPTVGSYTLNSTNNANIRPLFDEALIYDEDLPSVVNPIISNVYTTAWIGPSNVMQFKMDSTFPFEYSGTYIYWNNTTLGTQVTGTNNKYYNVYQILVPMGADTNSQQLRTVFIQPQKEYNTLAEAQAEDFRNIIFGNFANLTPESVAYTRLTYGSRASYGTTGKVQLNAISYVVGSRASQVSVSGFNPTQHNNLAGLQGGDGTLDEYYHLTQSAYNDITNVSTTYLKLDQTTPQTLTTSPIFNNLTAGTVPFTSATKTITDSTVGLKFNNTSKIFSIGDTVNPLYTSTAQLQLRGAVTGAGGRTAMEFYPAGYTAPSALLGESAGDKWVFWNGSTFKGAIGFDSFEMYFQATASSANPTLKYRFYGGTASNPVELLRFGQGSQTNGFVWNDLGLDLDARFEGTADANLLYVNAGTNRVGIGTASPGFLFDVNGTARATDFLSVKYHGGTALFTGTTEAKFIVNNGTSSLSYNLLKSVNGGYSAPTDVNTESPSDKWIFWNASILKSCIGFNSYEFFFQNTASSNQAPHKFRFFGGNAGSPIELLRFGEGSDSNGFVRNETGKDLDMRFESSGDANMFFLDGGTNRIGIGTATPSEKLDVNGTIKGTGYKSSDGSAGLTQDIVFTDADSVQHTLNFKNGLLVGYTTA